MEGLRPEGAGEVETVKFLTDITEIEQLSNRLKEGWEIRSHMEGTDEVPYLIKRNVTRQLPMSLELTDGDGPRTGTMLCDGQDSTDDALQMEEPDDNMPVEPTVEGCRSESCQFEYHIIHSTSYNVPVLYFTACKSDGKLLTLEEVWSLVPGSYQDRLQHQRWTFITQQEHPLLGRPFFQLHPCRTADLMKSVTSLCRGGNYVVTWLSSVGPVVGLELPLAFAHLCEAR